MISSNSLQSFSRFGHSSLSTVKDPIIVAAIRTQFTLKHRNTQKMLAHIAGARPILWHWNSAIIIVGKITKYFANNLIFHRVEQDLFLKIFIILGSARIHRIPWRQQFVMENNKFPIKKKIVHRKRMRKNNRWKNTAAPEYLIKMHINETQKFKFFQHNKFPLNKF